MTDGARSNKSFVGTAESHLLQWIAMRMPPGVSSDQLTIFGLLGALVTFSSYWAASAAPAFLFLASAGLCMNWFGDSLDGTLARFRNQERPRYGFFVDHSADLISQVLVGIGFGLSSVVGFSPALLLLCSYLAFVAHTFIRARVFHVIQIAYFAVGPTETRLALIGANLLLFFFPALSAPMTRLAVSPANAVCIALALVSFGGLIVQVYTDWRVLSAEERGVASTPRIG